ncbi:aminopeptidase [Paramicrobacterium agarici]|uniref:Aminopeptidase n=1 Tax=Paramicrobacterium agarici TaxID=630514 RepID=A0A2A9DTE9_9MICO|nr:aminopeptidase [Microbacterium agarici]PFG29968.1 aminopeptidase [Microbacterium agarici]
MSRWPELASHLANVNDVTEGSRVSIFITSPAVTDAADAFVREVYRRGGLPQVQLTDETYDRHALDFASDDVLGAPGPMELASMNWADVHVSFRGMVVPPDTIDERRLSLQRAGKGAVSTARWQNTRWTLVRVPSPEWAELIGVDFSDLMTEFFASTLANWPAHRRSLDELCARLDTTSVVRIQDADTDLVLNCVGRTWVPFAGDANLPDGEIATAPREDGVDGGIVFPGTFWFGGARITDLELEFEHGVVTASSAREGSEFVSRILDAPGARTVGELGIGTNPAMTTLTGDLLLDEKILGTVHIALGRSYPQCGGLNESTIHWDIVKNLRGGGSLFADDLPLIENGEVQPVLQRDYDGG